MKRGIWAILFVAGFVALSSSARAETVEIVDASADATFWLGGDEALAAVAEAVFYLGDASAPTPTPTPTDPEPDPGTTVWNVGESATAFVQDGVLYVRGSGAVTSTPWSAVAATVEKVKIAEDITAVPDGALDGMTALTQINGLNLAVFNNVAAGAVRNGGFTAIAIDPSTHTGTVTFRIKTATEVDAPDAEWSPVDATGTTTDGSSIRVPVPASGSTGFFMIVAE